MPQVDTIIRQMRGNPQSVRFTDLRKVCDALFGPPRQTSGSHSVYRTPWQGDPRISIQGHGGMAKAYQVRQVLKAIARLEQDDGSQR